MAVTTRLSRSVCFRALCGLMCLAPLPGGAGIATAQEAEPNEFVPLPAGTDLAIGYYHFGIEKDYNLAGGQTVKHSRLEANIAVARYVHFTTLFGQPAGFQLFEPFG